MTPRPIQQAPPQVETSEDVRFFHKKPRKLSFIRAGLFFITVAATVIGADQPKRLPEKIVLEILLSKKSGSGEDVKSFRRIGDLLDIKPYLDSSLYSRLYRAAELLELVDSRLDALSDAEKMTVGSLRGSSVFFDSIERPEVALSTVQESGDRVRVRCRYSTFEDGGVISRRDVRFIFKFQHDRWLLVNVLRSSDVSNIESSACSDMKSELQREVKYLTQLVKRLMASSSKG